MSKVPKGVYKIRPPSGLSHFATLRKESITALRLRQHCPLTSPRTPLHHRGHTTHITTIKSRAHVQLCRREARPLVRPMRHSIGLSHNDTIIIDKKKNNNMYQVCCVRQCVALRSALPPALDVRRRRRFVRQVHHRPSTKQC